MRLVRLKLDAPVRENLCLYIISPAVSASGSRIINPGIFCKICYLFESIPYNNTSARDASLLEQRVTAGE